jgi:hypothetical protein
LKLPPFAAGYCKVGFIFVLHWQSEYASSPIWIQWDKQVAEEYQQQSMFKSKLPVR